jgi:hypothetical protein
VNASDSPAGTSTAHCRVSMNAYAQAKTDVIEGVIAASQGSRHFVGYIKKDEARQLRRRAASLLSPHRIIAADSTCCFSRAE